jgi:hypothetical protein
MRRLVDRSAERPRCARDGNGRDRDETQRRELEGV